VPASLTLVLPRLSGWISQLRPEDRYPALETLLSRSENGPPLSRQLDAIRINLFGLPQKPGVPVAALGCLADARLEAASGNWCLRLDPVTLHADLNRIVLVSSGFSGFPADYQQTVRQVVQKCLVEAEGLPPFEAAADGEGWVLKLQADPGLQFASIDEVLGDDLSEFLPEGPAGLPWKKLHNEIQVALHQCAANQQRRKSGQPVINGVWLWGGGCLPAISTGRKFDAVYSMDSTSRGLGVLQGSDVRSLHELSRPRPLLQGRVLIDWAVPQSAASAAELACTPDRLEALAAGALAQLKRNGGMLEVQTPERHWRLQLRHLWRFWRRPQSLRRQLMEQLDYTASAT